MITETTFNSKWDGTARRPVQVDFRAYVPNNDFCLVKLSTKVVDLTGQRLQLHPEIHDPMRVARFCPGVVQSVGPGMFNHQHMVRIPMSVKPGDEVICLHQNGMILDPREPDYILIREGDLICLPKEET